MNRTPTPTDSPAKDDAAIDGASKPAISLEAFEAAYERWKSATASFEQAVRRMHAAEPGGREDAQRCARELAQLHHAFLEASQPHFEASAGQEKEGRRPAAQAASRTAAMAPGDDAPEGTPGTGQSICRQCGGSGRAGTSECATCHGTGTVNAGIGGA